MSYIKLYWFNLPRLPTDYENLQFLGGDGKPRRAEYIVAVDHKNEDTVFPCYYDFIKKIFIRKNGSKINNVYRWAKLPIK
jgi:hypothetical protein